MIKVKQSRDQGQAAAAKNRIKEACRGKDNLMPPIIEGALAGVTLGEVCDIFREVFGVYRDPGDF